MMTRSIRGGWSTASMIAVAVALTATLAACSGHGTSSNGILPTTGAQSVHVHPDSSPTPTALYGGGSSLAALLYRQDFDYYGVALPPDAQGASNGEPINSNFQYYYASTSSGVGRGAFLAQTPSTSTPASNPIYCPNGVTTCYPYPIWHFSDSDAILSATEESCYYDGCSNVDGETTINEAYTVRGYYLQVPIVTTPITIPYNPSGQTVGANGLNLDRNVL